MKIKTQIRIGAFGAVAMTAWLLTGAITLNAQDGPPQGGFSPRQMRQRMLERIRGQFEVTDDSEWKLISEQITKVMDARRALGGPGGPGGPFGGPGGGPPPINGGGPRLEQSQSGPDAGPNDAAGGPGGSEGSDTPGGPPSGGPGMFNRPPNPEMDALRSALDAKASSAELKSKIAELKTAQAKKLADLKKAQEELKELLTTRQEAIATTFGLL